MSLTAFIDSELILNRGTPYGLIRESWTCIQLNHSRRAAQLLYEDPVASTAIDIFG
jgi:hypothetical protein